MYANRVKHETCIRESRSLLAATLEMFIKIHPEPSQVDAMDTVENLLHVLEEKLAEAEKTA